MTYMIQKRSAQSSGVPFGVTAAVLCRFRRILLGLLLLLLCGCAKNAGDLEPGVEETLPPPTPHRHTWVEGICTECGEICPHPSHDAETRICTVCGAQVWHLYGEDQLCRICGHHWKEQTGIMGPEIYREADRQGSCIEHEIPVPSLGEKASKFVEVYLPYGYDSSRPYDLVLLYSGIRIPYTSWISDLKWVGLGEAGETLVMKNVYDNMIAQGLCRPMILVSISNYTLNSEKGAGGIYGNENYQEGLFDDYWDTAEATREDILPFLIEHYSTYADSSDPEAIHAARHHIAIGGFSNGAYFTVYGGMLKLQDCASAFIPVGGSKNGAEVGASIQENWESWPLDLVFFVCGKYDGYAYFNTYQDYSQIRDACPGLQEGHNLIWSEPEHGHDWETASIAAFNALQLLFCWND